jgi:hypothetical protein
MARQFGRWNPKLRFVELYLDGQYNGIYQLVEVVRQDRRRVDVPKPALNADLGDITGGYIFRREAGGKGGPTNKPVIDWLSPTKGPGGQQIVYTYHYPKETTISDQQKAYIRDHMARFEAAVMAGDDLGQWIDTTSFLDYALLNEITNNVDAYWKSVYIVKQSDRLGGKLSLTPSWDFNLAFGNADYREGWKVDAWAYKIARWGGGCTTFLPAPAGCAACAGGLTCANVSLGLFWMDKLWTDPVFLDAMKCRWQELRKTAFDPDRIAIQIEAWRRELAPAMKRHFARWERLLTYNWPNWYVSSRTGDAGDFFDDEVDFLKNWVANRIRWLDRSLPGTCRN